ncbi:C6 zinc finger domain protein [Aspergillus udagawae]|nr:C6 zinc finger domain protein [Aspergillus udagawae]
MFDNKTAAVGPTWDCSIPLNLNDFKLQPEMKTAPATNNRPTEMLFAVILSELADSVRHSAFHLDFTNPSLKKIADVGGKVSCILQPREPASLYDHLDIAGHLAKYRLLQHWRHSMACVQQTGAQRNVAVSHVLRMLKCDTNLMTSPLTKVYLWFLHIHFPFPAYIHLLQDLKERPVGAHADQAWEVMSKNYENCLPGLGGVRGSSQTTGQATGATTYRVRYLKQSDADDG